MSIRSLKHRSARLFYGRFHAKFLWRSAEEQQWLDMVPVGREFGSPDYDRLMQQDLSDFKSNMSRLIENCGDSCVDSKDPSDATFRKDADSGL